MPGGDEGILSEDPPVAEDGGADIPAFCAVDVMSRSWLSKSVEKPSDARLNAGRKKKHG